MKKGDIVKIKFFDRIVEAEIINITDTWIKVIFENITYKTSLDKIQK